MVVLIVALSGSCIVQAVKVNRLEREVTTLKADVHDSISTHEMDQIIDILAKHLNGMNDRIHQLEADDVEQHGG